MCNELFNVITLKEFVILDYFFKFYIFWFLLFETATILKAVIWFKARLYNAKSLFFDGLVLKLAFRDCER